MQLWNRGKNKCKWSDKTVIIVTVICIVTVLSTPHLPPYKDRTFSRCPYLIVFKFDLLLNDVTYFKAFWRSGLITNGDTVLFEVFVRP